MQSASGCDSSNVPSGLQAEHWAARGLHDVLSTSPFITWQAVFIAVLQIPGTFVL